jgi:hypothetical protein
MADHSQGPRAAAEQFVAPVLLVQSIEDCPKLIGTVRACQINLRPAPPECEPYTDQRGANCDW